jgi:hypothetical protein
MVWGGHKKLQHLVEHLAMLAGNADNLFMDTLAIEFMEDGGNFDGFWARSKNSHNFKFFWQNDLANNPIILALIAGFVRSVDVVIER